MPKFKDLSGKVFGDLTVIKQLEKNKSGKNRWLCECRCGRYTHTITHNILSGRVTSCNSCAVKRGSKGHKMSRTKLYYVWAGIKARCYNRNNKSFHNYGGRGIVMCDDWKNDFLSFAEWSAKTGYSDGLSIDRIDVNGNYCPENCRWLTVAEQSRNRRDNIVIEHNGEKKILADWADELGINRMLATQRYDDCIANGKLIVFDELFFRGRLDAKQVNQFSLDGAFIKRWPSLAEAGRNGYDRTGISMCCNGKRKTANGYIWKYESE